MEHLCKAGFLTLGATAKYCSKINEEHEMMVLVSKCKAWGVVGNCNYLEIKLKYYFSLDLHVLRSFKWSLSLLGQIFH